jgi:hypothetical protein
MILKFPIPYVYWNLFRVQVMARIMQSEGPDLSDKILGFWLLLGHQGDRR